MNNFADPSPVTYHCVLTVRWHRRSGTLVTNTWADLITLPPGAGRVDAWNLAFARLRAKYGIPDDRRTEAGLTVLFFSVEPNLLPTGHDPERAANRP